MAQQKAPQEKLSRIAFLNPQGYVQYPPPLGRTDTGGQTLYIFELAQALGKRGVKVDIITRKFDNMPEEEQVFENVKIVRVPCGPKTFVAKEKMYEHMPEMAENFMAYIERKRKKYDVLHSHYWDAGYLGLILAKMLDLPHIWTPHSLGKLKSLDMDDTTKLPPQKLKPAYRYHVRIAAEQKILNRVNAVITICETSRIQLLEHYIVDFEKIHVIYPGIDIKRFNTTPTKADKSIKMKNHALMTASRIVPAKGLDRLIDALALIRNKVDFHLYMAGSTEGERKSDEEKVTQKQLNELIAKHKLSSRVTFIPHIPHDKLPAYYRNADLFILASRYEPFGLTTLEAMACGTAPIVSSVAGSKEVIIDGLNGFLADTHNRKEFSQMILSLLRNRKIREKAAENAAFTIKEHYSWDKIADKFIKLYKKLL